MEIGTSCRKMGCFFLNWDFGVFCQSGSRFFTMSNQKNPEKIEIVGMYAKLYFQCIIRSSTITKISYVAEFNYLGI